MAKGDAIGNIASVAAAGYLNLQPGSGEEWTIHNITYAGAVEIYCYDGTNNLKCLADSTFGGFYGTVLHCTNTRYYRIKNVSAGAFLCGYDGVQTK